MTNQTKLQKDSKESMVLEPSRRLPLLISALGIAIISIKYLFWLGIITGVLGLFLLIQSFTLKLQFTPNDLVVLQLGRELRRFPFKNWLAWRLILPSLPGLLYFREKASPHLLPILFNPSQLEEQLKLKVGDLETPKKEPSKD